MDKFYIPLILLLLLASGVLFLLLYLHKKQLRDLKRQIDFIRDQDTNSRLTAGYPSRDVCALVESVNQALIRHRDMELLLRKMNRNFRETITSISHDLRTPLTSATGYLQLMQTPSLPEEKKMEYCHIVEERVQSVKKMLEQLFEFARIEANELNLTMEEVNLNNLLRDVVSMFYNDFSSRDSEPDIRIPDVPYLIQGDKDALKRVFNNIIHNSLVHGEGDFVISSRLSEIGNYCLEFSNRTHTITEKDADQIFERFYTTDQSRTRKTTGLGLSIAKKLTEMMGGHISARLEGEVFTICIVFQPSSQ